MQLLLPLTTAEGRRIAPEQLHRVRRELAERFGGVTAYTRAPATGLWRDAGELERDEVVMVEVMAGQLDRPWWGRYRAELEHRFGQRELMIRAVPCESIERVE